MDFFRPEYWSGQPFPSPGDLPSPGIEPMSPALQVDSLPAESQWKPLVGRNSFNVQGWSVADCELEKLAVSTPSLALFSAVTPMVLPICSGVLNDSRSPLPP